MVHQYKNNGYNIVLDVNSGAVHVVDDVMYDVIPMFEESTKEDIVNSLKGKYAQADIVEAWEELKKLAEDNQLFTKEEYEKLNKRLKRPIGKMGCRHRAYPVIIGISKPAYSEEELKEFKKNNHTEVNFEGKKMTKYEAIELQGKLETDMRYTADTLELATASGNEMLIAETKNRAQWIARKYNQLSKAADLPMRKDRVSSIDPKTDRFIQKVLNSSDVELTNDKNSSIMKLENDREVEGIDLHYIGKLDKKVYGSISKDIITDEVIITNERIQHIKDGHPNDYERYCKYLNEIIKKPDYIIEANKPNTALVLKAFKDGEEQFKTVLRIITSTDNKNFKNSIITFMKIDEKEWKRLIKNKKILYNPE